MLGAVGILIVFAMVFGGYTLAGGKLQVIIKSLPFELMMIGGAAIGSFLVANPPTVAKAVAADTRKVFSGPVWKPEDYKSLLCLLFELLRIWKKDPVNLEQHIDDPKNSNVFSKYPKVMNDEISLELICDTFRSATMNYIDPHQIEEQLDAKLDAIKHHGLRSTHALQSVADALPALGIVAAVLGVIKTMGSIDQPPEVLGKLIGGALVGTFLGVFLAYCIVAPFAGKIQAVAEEDFQFYRLIKSVLVAGFQNHSTDVCIEVGRQNTPESCRPSFLELSDALRVLKTSAA